MDLRPSIIERNIKKSVQTSMFVVIINGFQSEFLFEVSVNKTFFMDFVTKFVIYKAKDLVYLFLTCDIYIIGVILLIPLNLV